MHALVVHESLFGATRSVAEAVASGLRGRLQVDCVEVGAAPLDLSHVDLLAVGAPTHAGGMTRSSIPSDAQPPSDGAWLPPGSGIREWLAAVDLDHLPSLAVAFDTREHHPRVPGSAGRAAGRVLRRHGVVLVQPSESFLVDAARGPLVDGEHARAWEWAAEVAARVTAATSPRVVEVVRQAG